LILKVRKINLKVKWTEPILINWGIKRGENLSTKKQAKPVFQRNRTNLIRQKENVENYS